MLYSVEQRREIYKYAYDRLIEEMDNHICTFICPNLLSLVAFEGPSQRNNTTIKDEFPEFYSQKPKGIEDQDPWWKDNESGNVCRQMALLNAINRCTIEIESKQPQDEDK